MDSTTITSVSQTEPNNNQIIQEEQNQNQSQNQEKEQSLKAHFDFLENALIQDSTFDFDREECFTLRYDETCHNIAAGYSSGYLGIYNLEKPETSNDYRKAYKDLIVEQKWEKKVINIMSADWNPNGYKDKRCLYDSGLMHLNEKGYMVLDSCISRKIIDYLSFVK